MLYVQLQATEESTARMNAIPSLIKIERFLLFLHTSEAICYSSSPILTVLSTKFSEEI